MAGFGPTSGRCRSATISYPTRYRIPASGGVRSVGVGASALDPFEAHCIVCIVTTRFCIFWKRSPHDQGRSMGYGHDGPGAPRLHSRPAEPDRSRRRHRPPSREARAHRGRDDRVRLRHPGDRRLRQRARQEARRRMHSDREQPPRDRRPGRRRPSRPAPTSSASPRRSRTRWRATPSGPRSSTRWPRSTASASWAPASTRASCSTRCRSR